MHQRGPVRMDRWNIWRIVPVNQQWNLSMVCYRVRLQTVAGVPIHQLDCGHSTGTANISPLVSHAVWEHQKIQTGYWSNITFVLKPDSKSPSLRSLWTQSELEFRSTPLLAFTSKMAKSTWSADCYSTNLPTHELYPQQTWPAYFFRCFEWQTELTNLWIWLIKSRSRSSNFWNWSSVLHWKNSFLHASPIF